MSNFIGANFLSMEFIVTVLIITLVVIVLSLIIRKLLWKKLDNEVLLANELYDDMYKDVYSEEWEELVELLVNNPDLLENDMSDLKEEFGQLSKELSACKLLIDDFKESRLNGMDLKGANSTLTFINGMMDNSMSEINDFYKKCKNELEKTGLPKKRDLVHLNALEEKKQQKQSQNVSVKETPKVETTRIRPSRIESSNLSKPTFKHRTIQKPKPIIEETKVMIEDVQIEEPVIDHEPVFERREYKPMSTGLENESIIGVGSVIDGNIHCEENTFIKGKVNGSIYSSNQVEISNDAKVTGNIEASGLNILNGKVYGNINTKEDVYIAEDVYVKGDIKTNYASIEGAIEGNVDAFSAEFMSKSRVMGDIVVEHIHIEKGTKISGNLKMK